MFRSQSPLEESHFWQDGIFYWFSNLNPCPPQPYVSIKQREQLSFSWTAVQKSCGHDGQHGYVSSHWGRWAAPFCVCVCGYYYITVGILTRPEEIRLWCEVGCKVSARFQLCVILKLFELTLKHSQVSTATLCHTGGKNRLWLSRMLQSWLTFTDKNAGD